jgi:UDP-N-acetylglucosamine--N-acetylmuramyl-(pentapeptide) pyrophosphoryl-undecaprenol N-acetylglucosamine transferase
LTELAALGKPSVIVPLPGSHQWANAQAFARLGAIEVADQATLSPDSLTERVLSLLDDAPRRAQLARALAASMPRAAAESIARELLALLSRQTA